MQRGTLDELDGLRDAARASDGVIHLAYMHDISLTDPNGYLVAGAADLRAIETIGGALEESGKPLVITSGTLGLDGYSRPGKLATESDAFDRGSTLPRVASENALIALAGRGVRGSIVRLPPTVHSSLDLHGFIPRLIGIAREKGVSAFVGDGRQSLARGAHARRGGALPARAGRGPGRGRGCTASTTKALPTARSPKTIGRPLPVAGHEHSRERPAPHFGFLGAFVSTHNPELEQH